MLKNSSPLLLISLILPIAQCAYAEPIKTIDKTQVVSAGEVHGGLMLHLGCRENALLSEFGKDERFVAQGLVADPSVVKKLRAGLDSEGLYGRASIQRLYGARLPHVDHLVRFLIVEDSLGVADSELMRVLCPGGVMFRKTDAGWEKSIKPWPEKMDEWTHVRHGADGNCVSRDHLVGAPTNVRWISDSPATTSMSQNVVIVSARGRLFTVIGNKPLTLIAQDAFSGTLLWKRPYEYSPVRLRHHAFWIRPPLIALGNIVYIAGEALDASTGQILFTFKGNPAACEGDILLTSEMQALDAKTGEEIWKHPATGQGLVTAEQRVYFAEGQWPKKGGPVDLVCLDLKTGKVQWRKTFQVPAPAAKPSRFDGYAPNTTPNGLLVGIVVHQGALALEVSRTYLYLFSTADGRHLRSLRYKNWSPYASGLRALMIDNQLWLPEYAKGEKFDYGATINAYDLVDGKLTNTLKLDSPIRQRCRPPLASKNYMYLGGLNAVNLKTAANDSLPIARSACGFGLVPANGLIYVPPTHCRCYSMIQGFVALESRRQMGYRLAQANSIDHLQKGIAYRQVSDQEFSNQGWPAFRKDFLRQAHTKTSLSSKLSIQWSLKLSNSKLSSPVSDGSVVVVASADRHRLDAIDVIKGSRKWSFVAGARIDGPPTIAHGMCIFGCRDGWVYAVRVKDGALVWRNLAAPEDRRILVSNQLESAWPSLGPMIVAKGIVCAVAGRHNMAEGGIVVTGFDLVTGKKKWQKEPPHRPRNNPMTGGAYEPKSTDPRPTSAALAGWLVSDGSTVQIDRLGAFDVITGESRELFDARLDRKYTGRLRRFKNRSKRNDFEPWLLSAEDGKLSCHVIGQKLVLSEEGKSYEFRVPGDVRSLASAGSDWVLMTKNHLFLVDKVKREIRATIQFQGNSQQHGLAVLKDRVFITTEDGRLLSFGTR